MSGIVLELRDVITVLAAVGAPVAIYVTMRTDLATVKAELKAMHDIMLDLKGGKTAHSESLGEVREELAGVRQRISALERDRERTTGSFQALSAESTGPHKHK